MKILPTIQMCQKELNYAVKFCKDFFGEDVSYKINTLEDLKIKYQGILDVIKTCDDSMVKTTKTSCGGSKMSVDCLAVCESKVYKQTFDVVNTIIKIIELMQVNKLTQIKGFNFTNAQIEKGAQYLYEKNLA